MNIIYKGPGFNKLKKPTLQSVWWVDPGMLIGYYTKNFSLQGKTFSLILMESNCHKVADPAGMCSLFLGEQKNLADHPRDEKGDPKHCPYIYYLMLKESVRMFPRYNPKSTEYPIRVIKCRCGHYTVAQGQHRICISGTKGIPLPRVIISYSEIICGRCENPKSAHKLYTF